VSGAIKRFVDNFGVAPETPPPPLIPKPWRMPVFVSMVAVGIVLLALLLWLVVIPAINTDGATHGGRGVTRQAAPVSGVSE
jgi:hypothetical protein